MSSIRARLVQANIERDNILAYYADEDLRWKATDTWNEATRTTCPAPESAVKRWTKRQKRREIEREQGLQHSIRPGPWDEDLDKRPPGIEYCYPLGDGYTAVLNRDRYWMWRIYVFIPENHPYVGRHYDDIDIAVTYSEGAKFGYYLPESYTASPYYIYTESDRVETFNPMFPSKYVDYERALELAKELKEQFEKARENPVAKVEREEEEVDPLVELLIDRFAGKAKVELKKPMSYKDALEGRK